MNKKSKVIFVIFSSLLSLFLVQVIYLSGFKAMSNDKLNKKIDFVRVTGLPDLALSTESPYIRHRSLTNVFSIYSEDACLREYSLSSFTIANYKGEK